MIYKLGHVQLAVVVLFIHTKLPLSQWLQIRASFSPVMELAVSDLKP